MEDYDKEKDNVKCPFCKGKARRVLEWTGIAEATGGGWFGKSDGRKVI